MELPRYSFLTQNDPRLPTCGGAAYVLVRSSALCRIKSRPTPPPGCRCYHYNKGLLRLRLRPWLGKNDADCRTGGREELSEPTAVASACLKRRNTLESAARRAAGVESAAAREAYPVTEAVSPTTSLQKAASHKLD